MYVNKITEHSGYKILWFTEPKNLNQTSCNQSASISLLSNSQINTAKIIIIIKKKTLNTYNTE
jgi:hypothetical protein